MYAANTSVTVDKSKAEIEKILSKYGARQFMYGWSENFMTVGFTMCDRMIQFKLASPTIEDVEVKRRAYGQSVSQATEKKLEQLKRQKWRALSLVIKAKLEAVQSGISEFEHEFLAHIVLPNKQTVGEWIAPQIEGVYQTKSMPKLLLGSDK